MNEEQYRDLLVRLERIESCQQSNAQVGGMWVLFGICIVLTLVSIEAAIVIFAVHSISYGYRLCVRDSTGPLDDGEIRLMRAGEGGEPDRPVRISDLNQSEPEATEKD